MIRAMRVIQRISSRLGWALLLGGCVAAGCKNAQRPVATVGVTQSATESAKVAVRSVAADMARGAAVCDAVRGAPVEPVPEPREEATVPGDPADAKDPQRACLVFDTNVGRAADAVLAQAGGTRPVSAPKLWDHRSRPQYDALVEQRFHLTAAERSMLTRQGFVVPARFSFGTYSWAFHELYQSQLPLYVAADAIFHAIYASNDNLIASIEKYRLRPLLAQVLDALSCTLATAAADYPPEVARDLDLYIAVARSLLADAPVAGVLGSPAELQQLFDLAKKPAGLERVTLFGRDRYIDFSAYMPRGHYTGELAAFFRAAMWLSRLEFNLVSRSSRSSHPEVTPDRSETPREALVALALADLVERAKVTSGVALLDRAWALLAGKREDVSLADLTRLKKQAHIGALTIESASALRAAIGDGFQRRARIHYMPQGADVLPAITTFLGPRIVPDTMATRPLVHDQIPDRHLLHAADMAYALGHDRAKSYLTEDLAKYPALGGGLAAARAIVNEPLTGADLYSAWLGGVRALATTPAGQLPSFMRTPAFADLRLNSAVAAFGQLRHNFVLIAGQGYDAAGCEIPDGWVEPVPEVYAALADYAARGTQVMRELDPKDTLATVKYFARLGKVLRVLRAIAQDELAGRALTAEAKQFISMVAEYQPPGSGGGATYTGWYYDLFRDRVEDGLSGADFVADYYTSGHLQQVAYVGALGPRLGFFVVDVGGAPRLMVGPVARAYEYTGPLAARLTDETAAAATGKREPWAVSYTAPHASEPPLAVTQASGGGQPGGDTTPLTLAVRSSRSLGAVTVELLDHHRVAYESLTLPVGKGVTKFRFKRAPPASAGTVYTEGVHVKIGAFDYVQTVGVAAMGPDIIRFQLGGMPAAE